MHSQELEHYKKEFPEFSQDLSAIEGLFQEIIHRESSEANYQDASAYDIRPDQVAKRLHISEPLAIVLLNLTEKARLVKHYHHVYCPETEGFIAEFSGKQSLPDSLYCRYHESSEFHSFDEYLLETVFKFEPAYFESHKHALSV